MMSARYNEPSFYVYVIAFDQEVFGIFSTHEHAKTSLREQIEEGGPAWADCTIVRLRVFGYPEVG